MELLQHSFILLAILVILALGAEIFTNAIEWLGFRLDLSSGAVGSVLAAVGTALPETLIPMVAIVMAIVSGEPPGGPAEHIGIGAILGAPFMLATLGVFLVGANYFLFRNMGLRDTDFHVDISVMEQDFRFFLLTYPLGVIAGLASFFLPKLLADAQMATQVMSIGKYVLGAALIVLYLYYVIGVMSSGEKVADSHGKLDTLHLTTLLTVLPPGQWLRDKLHDPVKKAKEEVKKKQQEGKSDEEIEDDIKPKKRLIAAQLLVALAILIGGAYLIIGQIEALSQTLGVGPLVLSLLIVPVATELPEKFNSVIWVAEGKDTLALGNMSGAMVFQSTIPVAVGMILTRWTFDWRSFEFLSVLLALIGGAVVYTNIKINRDANAALLTAGGLLYLLYIYLVVFNPLGVHVAAPAGH